jgi:hypothetical protein
VCWNFRTFGKRRLIAPIATLGATISWWGWRRGKVLDMLMGHRRPTPPDVESVLGHHYIVEHDARHCNARVVSDKKIKNSRALLKKLQSFTQDLSDD